MPGQVKAAAKELPVLDEANVLGVLTEALTADVHAILANQTSLVRAHTAATCKPRKIMSE